MGTILPRASNSKNPKTNTKIVVCLRLKWTSQKKRFCRLVLGVSVILYQFQFRLLRKLNSGCLVNLLKTGELTIFVNFKFWKDWQLEGKHFIKVCLLLKTIVIKSVQELELWKSYFTKHCLFHSSLNPSCILDIFIIFKWSRNNRGAD